MLNLFVFHRRVILSSVLCMAMAIFYEAQGEPLRGKQAVAEVVNNRSIAWGMSTCEVVFQKGQFSWTSHTKQPTKKVRGNLGRIASQSQRSMCIKMGQ